MQGTTSQQALLTAPEVADFLQVRVDRVYRLIRQGVLPSVRIGRQIRVDPTALEEWIEAGGSPLGDQ